MILLYSHSGGDPMSVTVKSLGLDSLPRAQRLRLVQELWDSIAAEQDASFLSETQRQELQRRIEEDDAAPDDLIPWEQVKEQTLARLKKP
jgi:putative addiction module component (TIGR02574 family)